ncbi:MAG: RagB/SusD family nutrient uptake outer membrane protein [Prevotella sp.]|nr:RagB/SusD family nutrient uptake outer membrane protein [Prevotella sp.]
MLFVALGFTACSDSFLDKNPDERILIDNETKVVKLLTSAYPTGNYQWIGELLSDNIIDNTAPHMPSKANLKQIESHYNFPMRDSWDEQLFKFEPASKATYNDWDSPGTLWSSYYNSIATVNHALQAIDQIAEKNKAIKATGADPNTGLTPTLRAAKAEAQILRAYCHFMLANIFTQGYLDASSNAQNVGVPYVTEVEDVVLKDYDRETVEKTYSKIQKDLEEALPNINDQLYTKPKWHFNLNAAHAFAARFYLYTRQWQKVVAHANAVLGVDPADSKRYTLNYSSFTKELSSLSDFAKVWQSPNEANNLMLLSTYSILSRRVFGYRFSCAGPAARDAFLYRSGNPLWSGYYIPAFSAASFNVASASSQDYGITTSKIGEEFEYSDKIAGIGYPHQILRPFTGNILLLERAEAKLMLGDYDGCAADLAAYWNNGIDSFDDEQKKNYVETNYLRRFTPEVLTSYYKGAMKDNDNLFDNWDFTSTNVSSDYVIPAEAVPYMNCINEFRRYETVLEGFRFFDNKRWGMVIKHVVGPSKQVYTLEGKDPRRAIEVPWESLSAGMVSSLKTTPSNNIVEQDNNSLIVK